MHGADEIVRSTFNWFELRVLVMPSAAIYDCEGPLPNAEELAFFKDANPLGFILFADHCETCENVRAHTDELKSALGRDDVLFLIDQEGGRVARMKSPAFNVHPPMARFGELLKLDPAKAREAARLNAFLLGRMTSSLGVNVNCVPMLDVPQLDADPKVIGDRAIATHQDQVAELGAEVIAGLMEGGALPVIKHLPGHGRALVDSHAELPKVVASKKDLQDVDFPPFQANRDCLMGMTGHVVYDALDPENCATLSKTVIKNVIRGEIGFDGLLFSDDLRMNALCGPIEKRAEAALSAGCDIALCCNYTLDEKVKTAKDVPDLSGLALERTKKVLAALPATPSSGDLKEDYDRLSALLKPVTAV